MPTPPNGRPDGSSRYVIETLRQGGDQALSLYRQAARFGMDAAGMCMDTLTGLVPGARVPAESVTEVLGRLATAVLDVAEHGLRIQRELLTDAMGRLEGRTV